MASWTTARARIAGKKRQNPDADVTDLLVDLRAARAEDYIRKMLAQAPPLTGEQIQRLRDLLPPAPTGT